MAIGPAAAGGIARTLFAFLAKNWPQILAAMQMLADLAKKNPAAKEFLDKLQGRLKEETKRRSAPSRIQAMLGIVRETVAEMDSKGLLSELQARIWLDDADSIERALKLGGGLKGKAKRRHLSRLKERTDALLARMLSEVVDNPPVAREPSQDTT